MLTSALRFIVFRAPCLGCSREIPGFRRTCPHCARRYPTSRPVFYWTYLVLIALGIPSVVLFVLWYYLGVKL